MWGRRDYLDIKPTKAENVTKELLYRRQYTCINTEIMQVSTEVIHGSAKVMQRMAILQESNRG